MTHWWVGGNCNTAPTAGGKEGYDADDNANADVKGE